MSLTSVLGIVAVCVVLRCEAWPQIGQKANKDGDCYRAYGTTVKCSKMGKFTCAKLDGVYLTSKTMCDFCQDYGDSEAVVYYEGKEQKCQQLESDSVLTDDPECTYMGKTSPDCPDDYDVQCAKIIKKTDMFEESIFGDNRCKFCKDHGGNSMYKFHGTGDQCFEMMPDHRKHYHKFRTG